MQFQTTKARQTDFACKDTILFDNGGAYSYDRWIGHRIDRHNDGTLPVLPSADHYSDHAWVIGKVAEAARTRRNFGFLWRF